MLSPIKDSSVRLKVTPELRELIELVYTECQDKNVVPIGISRLAKYPGKDSTIYIDDVEWMYSKLPVDKKCTVYKVLEKCDVILPQPEMMPRNPELEARVQKLKRLAAEKEYRSMTKNVDLLRHRREEDSIGYQIKQMNRELIGVAQVIVSVSAGFAFGFLGIQYVAGTMNTAQRLMAGLMCSGIIAVAELYFFIKHLDFVPPPDIVSKKNGHQNTVDVSSGKNSQQNTVHHAHQD